MTMKRLLVAVFAGALALLNVPAQASGGRAMPQWMDSAVVYEVNVRQFSEAGSFAAVESQLPRLKTLGVDVLWLMPIYPISVEGRIETLGSYYAVADYKGINSEFGNAADLHSLINAAHEQGFKVILDWVANHTGLDNVWLNQHRDDGWYVLQDGQLVHPNGWNDVAQLNYDNSDMRAAMIDAMQYWVDTFEVDGFRCDYATGVPQSFWEEASAQLNSTKPLFMLAEDEMNSGFLDQAFDANYGWTFKDKFNSLAGLGVGVGGLDALVSGRLNEYPVDSAPLLFITNHDENSWNGTEYDRLGADVKVMTVLYFSLPGIPLVYNGQEVSFNRALAFFTKDEIDWTGKANTVLKRMIELKHENSALNVGTAPGTYQRIQPTAANSSVLSFVRTKGDDRVLVIANVSSLAQTVTLNVGAAAGSYREVMLNTLFNVPSKLTLTIPPNGYRVLSSQLEGGNTVAVSSMKVAKSAVTIKVGKSTRVGVTLSPAFPSNPTLTWKSANSKVATVSSSGLIVGKKRGSTTITVQSSNKSVKKTIKVSVR
jgi:glycosidase